MIYSSCTTFKNVDYPRVDVLAGGNWASEILAGTGLSLVLAVCADTTPFDNCRKAVADGLFFQFADLLEDKESMWVSATWETESNLQVHQMEMWSTRCEIIQQDKCKWRFFLSNSCCNKSVRPFLFSNSKCFASGVRLATGHIQILQFQAPDFAFEGH